jgi:excisionase family DNA binding protein
MHTNTCSNPIAYRPNEAARLLSISRSTLYRFVTQGHLQLVKIGERSSAIPRESILSFAEKRGIPVPAGL